VLYSIYLIYIKPLLDFTKHDQEPLEMVKKPKEIQQRKKEVILPIKVVRKHPQPY